MAHNAADEMELARFALKSLKARGGNFGHAGRPGKRGGSSPKGRGPGPADHTYNEEYDEQQWKIDHEHKVNGKPRGVGQVANISEKPLTPTSAADHTFNEEFGQPQWKVDHNHESNANKLIGKDFDAVHGQLISQGYRKLVSSKQAGYTGVNYKNQKTGARFSLTFDNKTRKLV